MRSDVHFRSCAGFTLDKILDKLQLMTGIVRIGHVGVVVLIVQIGIQAEEIVHRRVERHIIDVVPVVVQGFLKSKTRQHFTKRSLTGVPTQGDHIFAAPVYTGFGRSGCWSA